MFSSNNRYASDAFGAIAQRSMEKPHEPSYLPQEVPILNGSLHRDVTIVWAENYDLKYEDVLRMQAELVGKIMLSIEPELLISEADRARFVRTEDMEAFDLCGFNRSMQHTSLLARRGSVADEAKTEDLLHRRTESVDVGSLA